MDYYAEEIRKYPDNSFLGVFPAFTGMELACQDAMHNLVGQRLSKLVVALDQGAMALYYFTNSEVELIAQLLLQKLLQNPHFIINQQKEFQTLDQEFLRICATFENLSELSNQEMAILFQKYIQRYAELRGKRNLYYHFLSKTLEPYLRQLLQNKNAIQHFTLLTTSPELSWAGEEKEHFLELAQSRSSPNFPEKLDAHVKLFQGLMFDYFGPTILDKSYFLAKLEEYDRSGEDAEEELGAEKKKQGYFLQRQAQIAAELNLTMAEQTLFRSMQLLILMKEHKKKIHSMSHVPLQTKLLPEISRRLDLEYKYLRFLHPDEVLAALKGQNVNVNSEELHQRAKHFTIIFTPQRTEILSGDKAQQYNQQLIPKYEPQEHLTGSAASFGKHVGKVKLVFNEEDLIKVQAGDVLVTTMTRPQYILAMERAGAFVTNSGGITCHAAIIAREMNKPCVVGTNNATSILKDGDVVEVDAEKGIVRKIT